MNFIQNNESGDVHHIHRNVSRVLLDIIPAHFNDSQLIQVEVAYTSSKNKNCIYYVALVFRRLIINHINDILSTSNIDIQIANYLFQQIRHSKKRIEYVTNADTKTP